MMPLVAVDGADAEQRLRSRILNTRKLLTAAALIMSGYLIATTYMTPVRIPAAGKFGRVPPPRELVDRNVTFFRPLDPRTIYVLGLDGNPGLDMLIRPRGGSPEFLRRRPRLGIIACMTLN